MCTLLLLLAWLVTPAVAAPLNPVEVAERLQQTYEKTSSIKASFRQVTSSRMSRRPRRGNGTLVIVKPGRMRWDYEPPKAQVLICDGDTLTMYLADEKQLLIAPASEYLRSDITYEFFTGRGNILHDFNVMSPDPGPETGVVDDAATADIIKLIPKEVHPQVDYLHVWVEKKRSLVTRMQIVDQFGSVTDLYFDQIKTNQPVAQGLFTFTPPPGTEVIRQ